MSDLDRKRQFLACLSDPSRFSMVTTLAAGPRCVTELAGLVGLSQSCTTRHLQALLRAGIVSGERRGKKVVYALRPLDSGSHPVLRWACESLDVDGDVGAGAPGSRARDHLAERTQRRRASVAREIEVTDALVVAFDAPWEASDGGAPDDRAAIRELDPIEPRRERSEAGEALTDNPGPPPPERPLRRAPAEDLDDFLL